MNLELQNRYYQKSKDVEKKLQRLKRVLRKHRQYFDKNSYNWGYLGDLINLENRLDDVINFTGL